MRFAYIDSHGNEVPIPSVDALGLRIELGAIGPDTELYDAQADRWGPAKSHEIFHTLSRDVEEEGFVAPPPVAPPPVAPPPEEDDAGAPPERAEAPVALEPTAEEGMAGSHEEPVASEVAPEEDDDTAFGLTLADPPAAEETEGDLTAANVESPAAEGGGAFDFGDLTGGLELEPSPLDAGGGAPGLREPEPGDEPMELTPAGAEGGASDALELEQPLSKLETTPIWVEQDGPGGGDDEPMDFSFDGAEDQPARAGAATSAAAGASAPAAAEEPAREPPERRPAGPKNRPSKPRRRRARSVVAPILTVVLLGAAGVGAYVSWPVLSQRLGIDRAPPRPPVVIPDIPADLVPRMRALGAQALAETFEQMDERTSGPGVPAAPPEDWLFGVYLANASRFEEVDSFWSGMERFMSDLRQSEADLFHVRYLEAAKSELAGDTVTMLTERADSGFVAATPARAEVYRLMDDLIRAALSLHDFLVEHEADIAYEPAAFGVSGDPLLEAVPNSDEVRNAMWEMLEDLTNALDAMGTLDLVTRQELLDILHERVRDVAIQ